MKLTVTREALIKPLQMVIGVVDRKQAMPILSTVLLTLNPEEKRLSIVGTDLEIQLTGHSLFSETITSPCSLTLPGRKLLDICRALPDNAIIELSQDKQQIVLRSQRSRFTLSTLPATDYPNMEQQSVHLTLTVNQADLLRLLQNTHFAMAQQDVRYYLNGMLFEFTPQSLRTVSTDGHRLATDTMPVEIPSEHRLQVIVSRKGVAELMRLLTPTDQSVTLMVGHHYIQVVGENYSFISKLIEGRFPDYQRAIPKNGDKKIVIAREVLRQALIRAAILSNDKVRGIALELRPQLLRLIANNPAQELAEEEISVDYSGPEFGVAFNVTYLLNVLDTLTSEQIELIFSSYHNHSLLITELNGHPDQAFVVMPMKIS
jgi:DNA polymerase III subunit beta